jgi:hypothetical protein
MKLDTLGFGIAEFIILVIVLMLFLGLPIITLIDLARKKMTGTPLAIWVLIICIVPMIGSIAYWIVKPAAESKA